MNLQGNVINAQPGKVSDLEVKVIKMNNERINLILAILALLSVAGWYSLDVLYFRPTTWQNLGYFLLSLAMGGFSSILCYRVYLNQPKKGAAKSTPENSKENGLNK